MITADGTVVTLISRDGCPYIDDPEPNYANPAVVATQEVGNHVTWDTAFVSDEPSELSGARSAKSKTADSVLTGPRTYGDYGVLSVLAGGPKRNRWSDLADEEEDEYEGMTPINFTDPGDDSSVGEWEDEEHDIKGWDSYTVDPSRRENPYPAVGPLPGVRLSALAGVDFTWSVVGKINPKPLKLSHKGIHDIFYHLLNVNMVPSARKAVTGDGVCIGLTYKTNPFVHPKTQRNRELIGAAVAENRSHKAFDKIYFTSIQINHNTISAPHTDNNLVGTPPLPWGWVNMWAADCVLMARNSR